MPTPPPRIPKHRILLDETVERLFPEEPPAEPEIQDRTKEILGRSDRERAGKHLTDPLEALDSSDETSAIAARDVTGDKDG